jgi:hypothetical protein
MQAAYDIPVTLRTARWIDFSVADGDSCDGTAELEHRDSTQNESARLSCLQKRQPRNNGMAVFNNSNVAAIATPHACCVAPSPSCR